MTTESKETSPRRLYRSASEKMIAGVCGGLADYFNLDPAIVRLIFVLLALAKGFGVLLYLILWIVAPERPGNKKAIEPRVERASTSKSGADDLVLELGADFKSFSNSVKERVGSPNDRRNIFAVILIIVGLTALANQLFPSVWFREDVLGPAFLIIIGAYILAKR